jgi:hypothetical protein
LSIVSNGNYGAAIIRSSAGFITCVIGSAGNLGNAVNSYFEEEYWSYFIYDRLFASNPALQEIDLSQATGWGHIGTEAFENCANLKEIRFPNTEIDLIDEGAFKNCTGLEHIYWNHDVCPEVKSNAFDNVKKNGILHVSTSYRNSAGSAVETGQPVTDWGNLSDWKYAVES